MVARSRLEPDRHISIFIRLEARLQPNIGFTLRPVLAVFTRSGVIPPEVNRFGYNIWSTLSTLSGAGPGNFGRSSD